MLTSVLKEDCSAAVEELEESEESAESPNIFPKVVALLPKVVINC